MTAVNHGPDAAPAARVTVTPPPGLRFARSEASQGSFDPAKGVPAKGVWNIGVLETSEYLRAVGLPEGPTLTVFTEPAGAVGQTGDAQNQEITARIENAEDYCVRIKTGDPSPDNDLECRGNPPSGYTDHSAEYYDHRPDNNEVRLPADWSAAPAAEIRLTGIAITSEGSYQAGDDIEVTASFAKSVAVAGQPRLRLRVGEITREAALHSHIGSLVVFRYRVQEGDSDAVDGVSIPPSPFVLPQGAGISAPGGGTVSLFFAGLADDPAHRVYPTVDRAAGTNILVWSPPENLYTGVEGARYRLFERMRHYYRYNDLTRRWEIEFRIADATLDAPDQNLIQWLVLRANGYYLGRPHPYGAAPVGDEAVPGRLGRRLRAPAAALHRVQGEVRPGGQDLGEAAGGTGRRSDRLDLPRRLRRVRNLHLVVRGLPVGHSQEYCFRGDVPRPARRDGDHP